MAIWFLLAIYITTDLTAASPVQFPGESSSQGRHIQPYSEANIEPKFHHGLLYSHKKKKKRRKKKKLCLMALSNRFRDAGRNSAPISSESPEGRFFFIPLINYYDTDIHVYNGIVGGKPGAGGVSAIDPCSALISGGGSVISGIGSIITGTVGGVKPPSSITPGGGGGGGDGGDEDNGDEDYDYSDGGDSDSSNNNSGNSGSNLFSTGTSALGGFVSNAPAAVSSVLNSISNGIRPIFEGPNRYFDYYVIRPFNRSLSQLVRWF